MKKVMFLVLTTIFNTMALVPDSNDIMSVKLKSGEVFSAKHFKTVVATNDRDNQIDYIVLDEEIFIDSYDIESVERSDKAKNIFTGEYINLAREGTGGTGG